MVFVPSGYFELSPFLLLPSLVVVLPRPRGPYNMENPAHLVPSRPAGGWGHFILFLWLGLVGTHRAFPHSLAACIIKLFSGWGRGCVLKSWPATLPVFFHFSAAGLFLLEPCKQQQQQQHLEGRTPDGNSGLACNPTFSCF